MTVPRTPDQLRRHAITTPFSSPWIEIRERGGWFRAVNSGRGGAVILPIDPTGAILAIRTLRPAIDGYSVEIPRGGRDEGEDIRTCDSRELLEETGLRTDPASLVDLGFIHPDNGVTSTRLDIFTAPLGLTLRIMRRSTALLPCA